MTTPKNYAVCVRNDGYEESLAVRKIYEILEDPAGDAKGFVRVIDEDEDYLYPAVWFLRIQLPTEIEVAISARG